VQPDFAAVFSVESSFKLPAPIVRAAKLRITDVNDKITTWPRMLQLRANHESRDFVIMFHSAPNDTQEHVPHYIIVSKGWSSSMRIVLYMTAKLRHLLSLSTRFPRSLFYGVFTRGDRRGDRSRDRSPRRSPRVNTVLGSVQYTPVDTAREHGCHFGQPHSRAVFVTRAFCK